MSSVNKLFASLEDDEQVRFQNSNSPDVFTFDCGQLPFERMGDAHFELLLADLYTARKDEQKEDWYDKANRLNDGADQGRDVILLKDSEPVGVIQCKRYKSTVSLNQIVEEICKFFLYAVIKQHIAPPPGNEFRYHVAVADRAQAKLIEFMQRKGRKRFDDLRDLFEEKALAARKASVTLKKAPELKDLSKKELCDIIWKRINDLRTEILKKDDLSRMVAEHPKIKSTYFRLDQQSPKILEEIIKVLPSKGNCLPEAEQKLLSGIRTEYKDFELGNSACFNLGLIQGNNLLPFLKDMLEPQGGTLFSNFGSRPVVLVAGAEATKPSHWDEINKLVKEYPHPLVLMVGCGEVDGSSLTNWLNSDDMLWLDPEWSPAPARKYKAGWCWFSNPSQDDCDCYIIVENAPGDAKFDNANLSLRLAFQDVILWPTLGNDFTNPISSPKSQLRRLIASQAEDKSNRPNLIVASQQVEKSVDILRSVSGYNAQISKSLIAVAIANSGYLRDYDIDLYSTTGVFPAVDKEQITRATPPGINPPSNVMRRSNEGALILTINWSNGLYLEAVKGQRLFKGNIRPELSPEAIEFNELFERYPPTSGYLKSANEELDLLNELVQDLTLLDCSSFTYQIKYGVKQNESFTIDEMRASGEYLMKAVQALSFISSHKHANWVTTPQLEGHVHLTNPSHDNVSIMAWADHNYHIRQMEADLFDWSRKRTVHHGLIVFAHAKGHVRDKKPSHDRLDYTSTPSPRKTITEAQEPRNVYIFNLGEIESNYDDENALSVDSFMDDILSRRSKLDNE